MLKRINNILIQKKGFKKCKNFRRDKKKTETIIKR